MAMQHTKPDAASSHAQSDSSFGKAAQLVPFANEKAGMEQVDKQHVSRVIEQASKGSSYWKEQERKDKQTEITIERMKQRLAQMSSHERSKHALQATRVLQSLAASRVLNRIWVVVDLDQFFAAVAIKHNPSLADVPIAVGGMSMLSTASYAARKFGVRSAMPGFIAKRLCPHLVLVKSDFKAYRVASE